MSDRVVHAEERRGRFVMGEYLEMDGRVQSWVLAGEKGAVEVRGTSADRLYILVHSPVPRQLYESHSLHVLVDSGVLREECQVLEHGCSVFLIMEDQAQEILGGSYLYLFDSWAALKSVYDCYLGQS
jgi:hypothetical protein